MQSTLETTDIKTSPPPKKATKPYWFAVILKVQIIIILIIVAPYLTMNLRTFGTVRAVNPNIKTALILGAGLNNKKPSRVLELRLDEGGRMYQKGTVNTLLVSGTNTSIYYNEPLAMKRYLIDEWKVLAEDIIMDFGGRRTIDSCWRAKNVFKLEGVYVITQAYHLARTYFLCRETGLNTVPIIAQDTKLGIERDGFIREIFATWEALKNTKNLIKTETYEPQIKGDGTEDNLSER